jgi:hypothetical protein
LWLIMKFSKVICIVLLLWHVQKFQLRAKVKATRYVCKTCMPPIGSQLHVVMWSGYYAWLLTQWTNNK